MGESVFTISSLAHGHLSMGDTVFVIILDCLYVGRYVSKFKKFVKILQHIIISCAFVFIGFTPHLSVCPLTYLILPLVNFFIVLVSMV